jgi:hypothetical protein
VVFTLDMAGLRDAAAQSINSFSPLFTIAAGLVIAGGVLGWGIGHLKVWRGS